MKMLYHNFYKMQKINSYNKMGRKINLISCFLILFFIITSFNIVLAGNIIVKDGQLTVGNDFIVNNSRLFVNSSNGNIGIGTTTPAGQLHINGSGTGFGGRTSLRVDNTASGTAVISAVEINAEDYPEIRFGNTAGTAQALIYEDIVNGDMIFSSNANTDTHLIIKNSGKIGIGTTNPIATLHVNGSFSVYNQSGTLGLFVNSSTGRVGIGIANPTQPLVVSRGGGIPNIEISSSGGSNSYGAGIRASGGSSYSALRLMSSSGNIQIYEPSVDSYLGMYNAGGGTPSTVQISTNGNSWFNGGNIGIGTTSPNYALEINNNSKGLNVSNFLFVNASNMIIGNRSNPSPTSFLMDTPLPIIAMSFSGKNLSGIGLASGNNNFFNNVVAGDFIIRAAQGSSLRYGVDNGAGTATSMLDVNSTGVKINGNLSVTGGYSGITTKSCLWVTASGGNAECSIGQAVVAVNSTSVGVTSIKCCSFG